MRQGEKAEWRNGGMAGWRNSGMAEWTLLLTCSLLLLFSLAMDAVGLMCMEIYALQGHSYH